MNRRGLLGMLFLIVAVVVILVAAGTYYAIKRNGLSVQSGNVKIDVNYGEEEEQIVEIPIDEVNESLSNITNSSDLTENNNSLIGQNVTE